MSRKPLKFRGLAENYTQSMKYIKAESLSLDNETKAL